jgi:hypothetical protein
MKGYTEKELSQALEKLWYLAIQHSPKTSIDELKEETIFEEIDNYGWRGPAGLGLGRYGDNAIGDDDGTEQSQATP